jgi:polysaccharide biosynthesis/export protein
MGHRVVRGSLRYLDVLNCWEILIESFRGPRMKLGIAKLACKPAAPMMLLALCLTAGVAAQEPGNANQPGTPGEVPPAQPVSQAAQDASSGQTSNGQAKTSDSTKPPDAASQASTSQAKNAGDQSGIVKLGPGDLIEVAVYNVPELATKARVGNSGDVYLPLIDYVHVEGLTQEEAQTVIEKRLESGGFVRNPHVTIFVDEANSQGVTVLGEVSKPGIYPDPVDRKLYQVVSEAGGFTASASRKIGIIRHNQTEAIHIDLPRNLADDVSGNVDVLPGDTIMVPKAPIVYVVGDVGRPSGFLVDNGTLTVLQALALAGGTNRTAKMGAARIIRKTPSGMTETNVQLKKMLEAKVPDVTLQADDILFVPVSGARVAATRSLEAAMTLTTAVGIYALHP